MTIEYDDSLRMIEEKFRAGKPSEAHRRKRRASKRNMVKNLLPDIEALLRADYSFDGIANYFREIGLNMPVTTLKNYVSRARRDTARNKSGKKKPESASTAPAGALRAVTGVIDRERDSTQRDTPSRSPTPVPTASGTAEPIPPSIRNERPMGTAPQSAEEATTQLDPPRPAGSPPAEFATDEANPSDGTSSRFPVARRKRLDDL